MNTDIIITITLSSSDIKAEGLDILVCIKFEGVQALV